MTIRKIKKPTRERLVGREPPHGWPDDRIPSTEWEADPVYLEVAGREWPWSLKLATRSPFPTAERLEKLPSGRVICWQTLNGSARARMAERYKGFVLGLGIAKTWDD